MNIGLLVGIGCDQVDAFAGKDIGIKSSLHGEARAQQTQLGKAGSLGVFASRFDNADQRNGRLFAKFVEDQVRRIGGDYGKVGFGTGKSLEFGGQVRDDRLVSIAFKHLPQFVQVDAVDDDGRVAAVGPLFAIGRNDQAVVVDGGLRPNASDNANGFHGCFSETLAVAARISNDICSRGLPGFD